MKIKLILGLLAGLMLVEPVAAVAAPANGIAAHGYSTLVVPPVSEETPSAKVEKAYWVRRYWVRRYWYRPYWRRRFWYRPYWRRRIFWRRRFFY